jgi:hypothetical protein
VGCTLVADVDRTVAGALAGPVAAAVPVLAALIPPGPAAELGRIGAPFAAALRTGAGVGGAVARREVDAGQPGSTAGSAVAGALRAVGPLLAERLLGALELAVLALDMTGVPDLSDRIGQPPTGPVAFAHTGRQGQALTAVAMLDLFHPGATDLAASLTRELARHPLVIPLLDIAPCAADEPSIAAAHGAVHLALAVAVASAVVRRWERPDVTGSAAVVAVGAGIGAAVLLLRDAAMPAGYASARWEQVRQEYLMPRRSAGTVPVAGHQFALVEGAVPRSPDFAANGLVSVVPGGAVIRTGTAGGSVHVLLTVSEQPGN